MRRGHLLHVWGLLVVIVVATNWWARECWGFSLIMVSAPGSASSLPSCPSYCLQEYLGDPVQPGLMAGLWWCTGSPGIRNEQWSFEAVSSALFLKDAQGSQICLDIGDAAAIISTETLPPGSNRSLVLAICNSSSPTQRWSFDDAGRLTSRAGSNPSYACAYRTAEHTDVFFLYLQEDTKSAQSFVMANDSAIASFYTPALPTNNQTNLILNGNLKLLNSFAPVTTQPPLAQLSQPSINWVNSAIPGVLDGCYFVFCHWELHGNLMMSGCTTENCKLPEELCSGTNSNELLLFLNTKRNNRPGSITQAVPTYPGSNYLLLFETRNPYNETQKFQLSVSHVATPTFANGTAIEEFEILPNQTESQTHQFQFTASGNFVNVSFSSQYTAICGPFISDIQLYHRPVTAVDVPVDASHAAGRKLIIFAVTIPGSVLAAALCVAFYIFWRKRRSETAGSSASTTATQITVFSYEQLKAYTQNFRVLVGEGGFGKVYFGKLPEFPHQEIAVKRQNDADDSSSFQAEVELLSRVHHRYIVKFLGYCEDRGERMLVFEFMANKSLHSLLHEESMLAAPLSWEERIRIAYQVAYALEYLHTGANPPVLHRDVKAANVLLSDTLVAKLADLGISKAGRPNESEGPRSTATMTAVKGSRGYLDPYYLQTNMISHKSDVYSFGVLLLEMVTGQKAITAGSELLTAWAKRNYWDNLPSRSSFGDSREQYILDNRLHGTVRNANVKAIMEIARSCLYEEPRHRPCMEEVARRLREQLASLCTVAHLHTDEFYNMGADAQGSSSSSSYISSISGR